MDQAKNHRQPIIRRQDLKTQAQLQRRPGSWHHQQHEERGRDATSQ
jgi:hypothetical protein